MTDREALINNLMENHLERIFYFCLRKTTNAYEAEDLASDILLNILTSLNRGTAPRMFDAWVWTVARNRYSLWAKNKRRSTERLYPEDIGEYEIESDDKAPDERLIESEEYAALRRELAFTSTDCRQILLAYYFENRRTTDIAASLGIPKGTVESKLHRARIKLKDGMEMAREFGKRSYNPENVNFVNNCTNFGDNGQPWTILSHLMYKNIFLTAYGTPVTAEELSLELGIALPYMEDELKFLTNETFLIEENGRYETSFPIIAADTQRKIHEVNVESACELARLFTDLLDLYDSEAARLGVKYYGGYVPYEDAKWTMLMRAVDRLTWESIEHSERKPYTKRPNNGAWDIIGYEAIDFDEPPFVGQHGNIYPDGVEQIDLMQYRFFHGDIRSKTPDTLKYVDIVTILKAVLGEAESQPKDSLDRMEQYGYIKTTADGYAPNIVVFREENRDLLEKFTDAAKSEIADIVAKIKSLNADRHAKFVQILKNDLPERVKNSSDFSRIVGDAYSCRGYIVEEAVRIGYLRYDENTASPLGAYLTI